MRFSRREKDGQRTVTTLQFGAHEDASWPSNTEICLAKGCSPSDPLNRSSNTSAPPILTTSNVLTLPAIDGILLSTVKWEDVTLQGSSMTGLRIAEDLFVHGWMQFGSGAHKSSCDWADCSQSTHTLTTGILFQTKDLHAGNQRLALIASRSKNRTCSSAFTHVKLNHAV
jgi:hypothetical protein